MTKHRKTTRRRRSQKGGFSLNPLNWVGTSQPEDPNAPPSQGWGDYFSGLGSKAKDSVSSGTNVLESGIGNMAQGVTSSVSSIGSNLSAFNPLSSGEPSTSTNTSTNTSTGMTSTTTPSTSTGVPAGGRRRRHRRTMKGGKGGLGLTYYATPVSGLKVVEPTYLEVYANGTDQYTIKGGSRKRKSKLRKNRRSRRNKRH